jgi:hypothetical protein
MSSSEGYARGLVPVLLGVALLLVVAAVFLPWRPVKLSSHLPTLLEIKTPFGWMLANNACLLARPGSQITLCARLSPPERDSAAWEVESEPTFHWYADLVPRVEGDGHILVVPAPDASGSYWVQLVADARWRAISSETGMERMHEIKRARIALVVAAAREDVMASESDFDLGVYPDPEQTWSLYQGALYVMGSKATLSLQDTVIPLPHTSKLIPLAEEGDHFLVRYGSDTIGLVSKDKVRVPPAVSVHRSAYQPPRWFYPVTVRTRQFSLSPHFRLGDFDHDDYYVGTTPYPHLIAVEPSLVHKLEHLQELIEARFSSDQRIEIICGFRSPRYNLARLGHPDNLKTLFSRHQYGDAVDMIIDGCPEDGILDDLNGDGTVSVHDACLLFKLVSAWEHETGNYGGSGFYKFHDVEGRIQSPYVHTDTRGWVARWSVGWEE